MVRSIMCAPDPNPEADVVAPANVHTRAPKPPIVMREKSTRVRKPTVRFNLAAALEPTATLEDVRRAPTALLSVTRGLKLFKELTTKAIESEDFRELIIYFIDLQWSYFYVFY